MFPDHQITSKLEVRRAKGKPTQTHAGFAKWGWRLGINGLVPGAGRSLDLSLNCRPSHTFGVTEPSLLNGLHAGPATQITRPRDSIWPTVKRPGSHVDVWGPAQPILGWLPSAPVTRGGRRLVRNVHKYATTY